MKKTIRYFLLLSILISCKENKETPLSIQGQTMGTYYKVTYFDQQNRDFKAAFDQLLKEINAEVSTYEPESVISNFNKATVPFKLADASGSKKTHNPHFFANYEASKHIFKQSKGFFDPTVMPLVNYWGFGYEEHRAVTRVDSLKVKSLRENVGFQKIKAVSEGSGLFLHKPSPTTELDFSAIAKGYAVDAIGKFLEGHQIHNYLVDIGGELRASGKKPNGKWTVGINTPKSDAAITDFKAKLFLENMALATSGNYRNFHEVDGKKYSHTINPQTGFPELNSLLSASVVAKDCATADGFATAFMVMGLDKAWEIAQNIPDIDAYFIYSDENGKMNVKFTALFDRMIAK